MANVIGSEFVTKKFKPPSIKDLPSVDQADCNYSSEISEIVGVVSLSGQSGWPRCDEYEVHSFKFAAWRRCGEGIINRALTILRPVASTSNAFNDFEEGTIHRIQVILSDEQTRAIFVKNIDTPDDSELNQISEELKKPVVVQTRRFGPLTLNRRINWFEGTADWNGQPISILIQPDDDLDLTNQLITAESLFSEAASWSERVKQFAVQEKLDLANDWQEGEGEVTEDEFLERMTLETISIKPDGRFEFWHDDGDLFWGHSIQIRGSLKDGLTDSDIPG